MGCIKRRKSQCKPSEKPKAKNVHAVDNDVRVMPISKAGHKLRSYALFKVSLMSEGIFDLGTGDACMHVNVWRAFGWECYHYVLSKGGMSYVSLVQKGDCLLNIEFVNVVT